MGAPANLVDADGAGVKRAIDDNPLVLVDFWAAWCGPCRSLVPVVQRLAERRPALTVVKVDLESNEALAEEYDVQSLPSLLIFKSGACVDRLVGKVPYIVLERAVDKHA